MCEERWEEWAGVGQQQETEKERSDTTSDLLRLCAAMIELSHALSHK
jgi:hypothetical protein